MGADHPGDIASFMSYIKPDIGIVTAVAPSHVEGFGSVENILREKWLLAKNSDQAIINFDFDILQQHARQDSDVKAVSYATTKQADYCVVNQLLDSSLGERRFEVQLPDGQIEVFSTRLLAKHSLPALLAAIIVGVQLGVSMQVIKQAIKEVESPPGRLRIYRGINDSSLIDDTYNANSTSMIAALDFLGEVSGGRKVAVLGSINELGTMSCSEHELVGRHCSDLDHLVTIGDDAKNFLVPAAIKAGLSPEKITSHESPVAAGLQVRDVIKPGDWVLFKGSQNQVFAEEALKQVLESQGDIPDLVRQSNYWLGKKHAQFPDISL